MWDFVLSTHRVKSSFGVNGVKLNVRKHLLLYLVYTGFLGQVLVILLFVYLQRAEGLKPRQVFIKAFEHYDISNPLLLSLFRPVHKFVNVPLDGEIKQTHPRIVLSEIASWNGQGVNPFIDARVREYKTQKIYYEPMCGNNSMLPMVVCWLTTKDSNVLVKLSRMMQSFSLNKPTADTTYSNGWELALAYDLTYSGLNETERGVIEKKIALALKESLSNLDEDFASLWHGRATHASIAWICAAVLSDEYIADLVELRQRAQAHFLTAIDGLAYTEIWPNGYNYWIQSRAFLFALASSAYVNGLVNSENKEKILNIMRRVGYWHVYATRPDNKIEGFGDEGSRVDLIEETQRVIDLIVQMTRDPILAGYSKYISYLHKSDGYYRHYRWGILLFNDPTVFRIGDGTLASVGRFLKKGEIFGQNATNYIYLRSGWGKDDTFISFKAGHSFSHHAHYDAGHFTIFKGSPLATNSSTYYDFFSEHRLNYAIRTVAKNSLLILKKNERVRPNRFFKINVADGGQRLTLPTGSAIMSVDDWLQNYNQGKHLEGAELLHFTRKEGEFYYIDTDLTRSYNNTVFDENGDEGKVKEVRRQLLYLPAEDQLILYDKVVSTSDSYIKKWLLHSVNKPKVAGLSVLRGKVDNGILESNSDYAEINNGRGWLRVKRFLPENGILRLVGGKNYQYYVEDDADDSVFDGKNYNQGSLDSPWFDVSMWRIEIQPKNPVKETDFLVVISPSLDTVSTENISKVEVINGAAHGVETRDSVVLFAKSFSPKEIVANISRAIRRVIILSSSVFDNSSLKTSNGLILKGRTEGGMIVFTSDEPISGRVKIIF